MEEKIIKMSRMAARVLNTSPKLTLEEYLNIRQQARKRFGKTQAEIEQKCLDLAKKGEIWNHIGLAVELYQIIRAIPYPPFARRLSKEEFKEVMKKVRKGVKENEGKKI